jgi:hypothetical protein
LKDYAKLNENIYSDYLRLSNHSLARQHAIGSALSFLRSIGVKVDYSDGQFDVDTSHVIRIMDEILLRVGGFFIINEVIKNFENVYDSKMNRYHFVRRYQLGNDPPAPHIPIGFLFNFAVKKILPDSISNNVRRDYSVFVHLATALCATLGVQNYNKFVGVFAGGEKIVSNLQRSALYDSVYTLPQMDWRYIRHFEGMFDWVDDTSLFSSSGWRVKHAFSVANSLLEKASIVSGVLKISLADIESSVPHIDAGELEKILEIFSHDMNNVNRGYHVPYDAEYANFAFKPLIRVKGDSYFMPLHSWCSLNFYEAIAQGLRDCGFDKVTDRIGLAQENVLKNCLFTKGVTYSCGKYNVNGVEGECDVVVETTDTIVFIELKAKALTRKAKSGKDVDILIDVSKSLIDSQLQLGRHELLLLKGNPIILDDNGVTHTIALDGRNIERISLTLLEYTGFHDRIMLSNMLETFHRLQVVAHNKVDEKEINKFSKKCNELRLQLEELVLVDPYRERKPFFNCWFLSFPKIMTTLEDAFDNDSFVKSLLKSKHMTMMSGDFYFEHSYAKTLKEMKIPEKTTLFTM